MKSWFFEKMNKIGKLTKRKTQINTIRDKYVILQQIPLISLRSLGITLKIYIPINWKIWNK
jgi:hypothetical protein